MTAEKNKNKEDEADEEQEAKQAACLVVIFLHGVGGCGGEWRERLAGLLPPGTRICTPTAPTAPVTLFGNKQCNSWYGWTHNYRGWECRVLAGVVKKKKSFFK